MPPLSSPDPAGVAPAQVSLTRFLIEEKRADRINPDLRLLIEVVARACKRISVAVGKGALGGVLGDAGTPGAASMNVQGEAQKKLDVIANDVLLEANAWGGHLAACASEEMEHCQPIPDAYPRGNYLLLFDPLDGSSNIDVNVGVGTIFSVLHCPEGVTVPADQHFLQPGTAQVAAGYCIYGPSTMLVLTIGHGTHAFTLDREQGSFVLTRKDMRVPEQTQEFAINMSNQRHWEAPMQAYVDDLLAGATGPRGKDFNMRWIASMVADVHRILTRGGIFIYPWDRKDPSRPATAPAVRGQSDELAGRTGRRRGDQWPQPDHGDRAGRIAPAGAGVPGVPGRGRRSDRLPLRLRRQRSGLKQAAIPVDPGAGPAITVAAG